jgi:MoaA/NifB/PqqE/SkfB family radical SAM enzyme
MEYAGAMNGNKKRGLRQKAATVARVLQFAGPFLSYNLFGKAVPVLAGYKITHRCNLRCSHCPYWTRSGPEPTFEEVLDTMRRLKSMGARIIIFEGGEPLLWRDGNHGIKDAVWAARELFPCVCMTTNGTLSWDGLPLDRLWVSLDGPPYVHDAVRGKGTYSRVMRNLQSSPKTRAYVSTTISTENADSISKLVGLLTGAVEGITIQFYYPYDGLPDPLFLPHAERAILLDQLIMMKRLGYPIMNSFASLEELKGETWSCEEKLLANAEPDGTILHGCYLKNRGPSECSMCGFAAHNEMTLAFRGKLESIITGTRVFFSSPYTGSFPEQTD